LTERLSSLPGVRSVGLTSDLPWTGYDENAGFIIEGKTFPGDDGPGGRYHFASSDYFRAVGVPLFAGRFFNESDRMEAPSVVLINRAMADRYWPGENAVGQRFTFSSRPQEKDWFTIVGVVGDVKDFPHSPAAAPAFYWNTMQQAPRDVILAVRGSVEPSSLIESVRNEVRALDQDLPLADVKSLDVIASTAVAGRRLTLWLVGFFAMTALVLAAVGIYSVLSYLVAQRAHEIGVRMALGAQLGDVLKLVVRQGMTMVLLGVALGLAAAFALTRLMKGLLFGVSATDPLTFSLVAILLSLVALFACCIPAWRATKVDPLVALRGE
jgi:predicted permease